MNSCTFLVRIISQPEQSFFKDNTPVVEMYVKFATASKRNGLNKFRMALWGDLAKDFSMYFRTKDYVIIKGIFSLRDYDNKQKELEFTVKKIYPFLLYEEN